MNEPKRRSDDRLSPLVHDLRNCLTAIDNAVQLARLPAYAEKLPRALDVIERQTAELRRLVDSLRQTPDAEAVLPPAGAGEARGPGYTYRILVVDDQDASAELLQRQLANLGHTVRVALDGAAALRLAREERADVLLSDLRMPGALSGYELAHALRGEPARCPRYLIALSGDDSAESKKRSAEAGFDLHVVKPLPFVKLRQILDSLGGADLADLVRG